ncbi:MAG: copper-containing nitrite reductase [Euryarchaeota archaeon]|nr:copper-containing nitrite reductase [Euryarchaeota archaeon]
MDTQPNRRTVLRTAAVGGSLVVAGCLGSSAPNGSEGTVDGSAQQTADEGLPDAKAVDTDRVAADPTAIPDPVDWDEPREHDYTVTVEEVTAEIEPGVTFDYMTYGGQVPGPMVRVRQGDTVNLTFENPEDSNLPHNVDYHAVYGPGGGAEATTTAPDETAQLQFKATYPGAYIYHCAVQNMDMHISAGMFGIILVEPQGGLTDVDHEIYLGQHGLYTKGEVGEEGHHAFDVDSLLTENPTYVVMNGEKYAMTADVHGHAATVKTGDTARVYFVNGGPNITSSFHPIGNVWKNMYPQGSLSTTPQTNIQTTPVPPGSTTIATMEFPVPGTIKLVDHALTRVARKGCLATVNVTGEENSEVFNDKP